MSGGVVTCEVRDAVAWATIDNTARANAMSSSMGEDLRRFWERVRTDPDIRVAVVTGAGDRHFCGGIDLQGVADRGDTNTSVHPYDQSVHWTSRNERVWKPMICAVNGVCAGSGLQFVSDADLVVASDTASFTDPHVDVGMVGGLENIGLVYRMGLGGALALTLLGKSFRMPAERAHQLGLVDFLVGPDELEETAQRLASDIAQVSPQAASYSLQAIWRSLGRDYDTALELGWALIRGMKLHPDFIEGPRAFAERRAPRWQPTVDPA